MKFYVMRDPFNETRNGWLYSLVDDVLDVVSDPELSDAFVVIGGDGSLLNAVKDKRRGYRPILPLNGGSVGANLLDVTPDNALSLLNDIKQGKFIVDRFPCMFIEAEDANGTKVRERVFNDAWVDRLDARSVRYKAFYRSASHSQFLSNLPMSGDGVLFSTATGSTGYARVKSGIILPHGSNNCLFVPMDSSINKRKVPAMVLEHGCSLEVSFLDTNFRRCRLAVDGEYVCNSDGSIFEPVSVTVVARSRESDKVPIITVKESEFHKKQFDFIGG